MCSSISTYQTCMICNLRRLMGAFECRITQCVQSCWATVAQSVKAQTKGRSNTQPQHCFLCFHIVRIHRQWGRHSSCVWVAPLFFGGLGSKPGTRMSEQWIPLVFQPIVHVSNSRSGWFCTESVLSIISESFHSVPIECTNSMDRSSCARNNDKFCTVPQTVILRRIYSSPCDVCDVLACGYLLVHQMGSGV